MNPENRITSLIKIILPFLLILSFNITPDPVFISSKSGDYIHPTTQLVTKLGKKELGTLAEFEPWRGDLREQLGTLAYNEGDFSKAEFEFGTAFALQSLSPAARLMYGESLLKTGNREKAFTIWKTLIQDPQYSSKAFTRLIDESKKNGDFASEADFLKLLLIDKPDNSAAAMRLGLIYSLSLPEESRKYLTLAATINPNLTKEMLSFQHALSPTDTTQPGSYQKMILGRALGQAGDWDLAAEAFYSASLLSPGYAEARAFLGIAREQSGQDGFEDLKEAESLNTTSALPKSILSLYWRWHAKPEAALAYLYAAANLEPEEPIWQIELGNLLSSNGNLTLALYHFQKAVDLRPEDPSLWKELARFCHANRIEMQTIGLPAARTALNLLPDDPGSLTLMGAMLISSGDYITGKRFLDRSINRDRSFAEAYLVLGQMYLNMNQRGLALENLLNAAKYSNPNSPDGSASRRLLKAYFGVDK